MPFFLSVLRRYYLNVAMWSLLVPPAREKLDELIGPSLKQWLLLLLRCGRHRRRSPTEVYQGHGCVRVLLESQ